MQHRAGSAKADIVATIEPFQLRGRFLTAVALKVARRPDAAFYQVLDERLTQTPQFFEDAPVVIDLAEIGSAMESSDLSELVANLRRRDLAVFGVQNGNEEQIAAAAKAGLITLSGGRDAPLRGTARARAETRRHDPAPAAPPARAPEARPPENRLVAQNVRSGQSMVADRGDLTIVGNVSSGAELIAVGNIHIYGRLHGRAMAGANGNEAARIFCRSLDAELLAVAGLYRTNENLGDDVRDRPVQVFLEDERLKIEPLG